MPFLCLDDSFFLAGNALPKLLNNLDTSILNSICFTKITGYYLPKELTGIDASTGNLKYSASVEDPNLLRIINEIIEFSIPQLEEKLNQGKEIFDGVQDMIQIEPIGILPLYKDEGYFLVNCDIPETDIFSYKISQLENEKRVRILETTFLKRVKKSISNTYYSIKEKLITEFNELPTPATYLIHSKLNYPKESTLMPVAKRMFLAQHMNH